MQTFADFLRDAAKYGTLGKAALHWQAKQESCDESVLSGLRSGKLETLILSGKSSDLILS